MQMRKFTARSGHTLEMSRLGLGSAPLADLFEILQERTAVETIARAQQLGVTVF